jgi:predicted DNA-binding protein (UPF0251 family)
MHIATVELETGESDCAQPSPEQRRRIMDFMARSRSMIPELASALRRAEAERDAQHAEVLRLTGERDALQEACDRKALQDRQAVQYIMSLRDSKILRLQERVATLELLRRGGK